MQGVRVWAGAWSVCLPLGYCVFSMVRIGEVGLRVADFEENFGGALAGTCAYGPDGLKCWGTNSQGFLGVGEDTETDFFSVLHTGVGWETEFMYPYEAMPAGNGKASPHARRHARRRRGREREDTVVG